MSMWIAGAVFVGTTALQANVQRNAKKNAKKDAEKQALEDEKNARKAEVFAETEGEGIGSLGQISLEVDEDLEDDEVSTGNIRI